MYTSEEFENFDIFPKKYTVGGVIKYSLYIAFMVISNIFMYSFYSGKDFLSVLTLQKSSNYLINRIANKETNLLFQNDSKYTITYSDNISNYFIIEYINENYPCIIQNGSIGFNITDLYYELNNTLYNDNTLKPFFVEKKETPFTEYFHKNFIYTRMNYTDFLSPYNDTYAYIINDHSLNILKSSLSDELITKHIQSPLFKTLNYIGLYYTEGNNMINIGGHQEPSENFICVLKGEFNIILIPSIQRKYIYPFLPKNGPVYYSQVNFYNPNYKKYPLFSKTNKISMLITEGDCLYVPSYWYRSILTKRNEGFKYFTMKFEPTSRYVNEIIKGIDIGRFK